MSESSSNESVNLSAGGRSSVTFARILLALFLLSLSLMNPIVHGDAYLDTEPLTGSNGFPHPSSVLAHPAEFAES
jgi:hypothetical protein